MSTAFCLLRPTVSTTCLGESPIDYITLVHLLVVDNITRNLRSAHLPLGNGNAPSQGHGQGQGAGLVPCGDRARQTRNERDRKIRRAEMKGVFSKGKGVFMGEACRL
jgi:hypothetical protein